jgi:predicted  nucleic acid-binding Zn-ribbon protein
MIARRRQTSGGRNAGGDLDALGSLEQRANILLVRADDTVKNAEDELGFAVAQFGAAKSREFEEVLVTAQGQLREAFGLQQKLDDAFPDSETQRRDWNARIIHLCESAQAAIAAKEQEFAGLRDREKSAPDDLARVQRAIEGVDARIEGARGTLARLRTDYVASAIATVVDGVDRAQGEREKARAAAERARALLDAGTGADGSESATDLIRVAGDHAHRAGQFLDAIDTLRDELGKASDAVTALRESTRKNLAEARALRDAPPDADASAAVGHAIETVEHALATHKLLTDPLATLEILRAANAELDSSMAGARNQQRRLDGARTALVGALVGARSQLATTRDFITTRRGGVGAVARTRLAEAERLLTMAEAQSDPVAALDLARSSSTYSRDADALARYDLMNR